jgi:hypothetical protein
MEGGPVSEGPYFNLHRPVSGRPYACPCCGHLTLTDRGKYQICQVRFCEDDGQDTHDADEVRSGPNGMLSLPQARRNFARFGASRSIR